MAGERATKILLSKSSMTAEDIAALSDEDAWELIYKLAKGKDINKQLNGKPKKPNLQIRAVCLLFFALAVMGFYSYFVGTPQSRPSKLTLQMNSFSTAEPRPQPTTSYDELISGKAARGIRKEKIESAFSLWNGEHIELSRLIKNNLRDPKSYEHIVTKYIDEGDYITVATKYRARNGFGGMSFGVVKARADINGHITQIISQE